MDADVSVINTRIVKLELEVSRLKEKEKANEMNQKSIHELALLVNTLTTNVNHMLTEQKNQGKRLSVLEIKPIESAMYYKRLIIGTVITTVVGVIIATIIAINASK